jgi:hypothetical protein
MTNNARKAPALGPFLESLEESLRALPPAELRHTLLAYAAELPASARAAFLAAFTTQEPQAPDAEPLLADIDDLLRRIRDGEFYDGWGWDDDIHRERAFGDVSWSEEMDILFDAAGSAFVAEDIELARQAYGRLLHAIWGGEEAELLSGTEEDPTELLETDLDEAKARYLRAVYETTPPRDRATALLDEVRMWWFGRPVSIADLRATRREDLPDLGNFLSAWIELLAASDDGSFVNEARRLLSEAVLLRDGTEGLTKLARERGISQPQLYLDLLAQLEREDRSEAAAEAAVEALAAPVPAGEVRAKIADRLAALTGHGGEPAPHWRRAARHGARAQRQPGWWTW